MYMFITWAYDVMNHTISIYFILGIAIINIAH